MVPSVWNRHSALLKMKKALQSSEMSGNTPSTTQRQIREGSNCQTYLVFVWVCLVTLIERLLMFLLSDKAKPCVSHRDLNSRNILVKADMSCCLCDLGYAMKISGSKYFYNGEEQHAETKSINDVSICCNEGGVYLWLSCSYNPCKCFGGAVLQHTCLIF